MLTSSSSPVLFVCVMERMSIYSMSLRSRTIGVRRLMFKTRERALLEWLNCVGDEFVVVIGWG